MGHGSNGAIGRVTNLADLDHYRTEMTQMWFGDQSRMFYCTVWILDSMFWGGGITYLGVNLVYFVCVLGDFLGGGEFGILGVSPRRKRILYALPAFYGFILQRDVDRIDAMFRKAKRWGITTDEFNMDFLSTLSDSRLLNHIKFDQHCLHHLLPQVHEVPSYNLRGRPTSYEIPRAKISKLLNSFIHRCANLNY